MNLHQDAIAADWTYPTWWNEAVKDNVIKFNMQQASASALADSQKTVDRVEKKLVGSTAKRQPDGSWAVTQTGSERFKDPAITRTVFISRSPKP